MTSLSTCAALAVLACSPFASAQVDQSFVMRDGDLMVVDNGFEFRVDMKVITTKLADGVTNWSDLVARLEGEPSAASLAAWKPLRENRLGFIDIELDAKSHPLAAIELLEATGLVELAEINGLGSYDGVPNDADFGQQWGLQNVGQSGGTPGADMNVTGAWEVTGGSSDVVIAVLDSGTEHTHSDLAANIWQNAGEIASNGVDDDNNGFIDDTIGWDFDGGDNNPAGSFFHGTAVAGCAGGVGNNGIGIAGTGGGGDAGEACRLMPINVGSFSPIGAILDDAILYAADNGADIITLSLTVPQSAAIDAAVAFAHDTMGVFIDCAAGNNGSFGVGYPAILPKVMAVASMTRFDTKAGSSSIGPTVEVTAPGEDIYTTSIGNAYTTTSGTSFAAPHLAGVAGLILAANPSLTNVQVRQILIDSAVDMDAPGFDNNTGFGRIDATAAVGLATGGVLPSVLVYGQGLPGLNGLTPLAQTGGGSPSIGNANFEFRVSRAAPNSPATLVLGFGQAATPFKGGTLNVDLSGSFATFVVTSSGTGLAGLAAPIPNDPLFPGIVFNTQWVIQDVEAVLGVSLSKGLEVTIGG